MARLTTTYCIGAALSVCLAVTGCRSTSIASTTRVRENRESLCERESAAPAADHSSLAFAGAEDVADSITLVAAEGEVVEKQTLVVVQLPEQSAQTIDLSTALMLTAGRSPQVAFANARIEESRAQLDRAESLWLPSLRAGANYNKHEGRIQDVAGTVIETSRGSVYSGLGAGAVGAGSPAVPGVLAQFHVTDAVFQPRIAQQSVRARDANARAATNDSLLATSLAYVQLLRASQEHAVANEAMLQSQELERVTREFAAAGQGLTSDHDRARAEFAMRKNELQRANEGVHVASARLAEKVRWEYAQVLQPAESHLHPITMVENDTSAQSLVSIGLSHRPEIAESRHLVCEAVERLNRERYAPLIPSVLLGVSYGGLAGGLGSNLQNSGDRLDADAVAYWELRQLGFGEQAARREASSRIVQTRTKQIALMDQIAREIVESHAQTQSRWLQIQTAQEAVSAAQDSFDRNWDRIENGQGLPIEVLQSIQALTNAQREYTRAVADYNVAQFTLHRSLGWPVDASASIGNDTSF
ncbi:MAG: TolC family protein [Planctomycetaceae bacterium]